jgi:nucleotide-binding universal stress UspA family protein
MKDIQTIMVAVDFSSISLHLVRYAINLGRKLNADVHLVNIINQRDIQAIQKVAETTNSFSLPEQIESMVKDRVDGLKRLLADLDIAPEGYHCHVRTGIPYEALIDAINELDIDLLVMGTRGRGQFSGMLFGSTAARMLHKCPVPLLTLRDGN